MITTWLEPSAVPHPRRALLRGLGARRAAPLHVAIVEHEEAGVTPAARGAAARLGDVDRVTERRRSRVRGYSGPRTVATSGSVHGNTSSRWTARAPARGDTLDGDGRAEREVDIAGDSVQRRRSAGTRASRPQGRVAAGRSIGHRQHAHRADPSGQWRWRCDSSALWPRRRQPLVVSWALCWFGQEVRTRSSPAGRSRSSLRRRRTRLTRRRISPVTERLLPMFHPSDNAHRGRSRRWLARSPPPVRGPRQSLSLAGTVGGSRAPGKSRTTPRRPVQVPSSGESGAPGAEPGAARPRGPRQGVITSVRTIAAACSRQALAGAARQVNVTW